MNYKKAVNFIRSDYCFYGILALAVLQGLWYALSVMPALYDEGTHLGFIALYTHHASPFITHQSSRWDYLGEVARNSSYLFYYLLSIPARVVGWFTNSQPIVIITLRLIMIAVFATGLYVYRKVLLLAKVPKAIAHIALLIFILTPILAPEAGVVNYDNAAFLMTAVILLLAIQVVNSSKLDPLKLALLLVLGLAGSEVKFEFIAIFVPVILFVGYDQLRKHGKAAPRELQPGFARLPQKTSVVVLVALLLSLGMFIERPVYNLVRYHGVNNISCSKVISQTRCLQNPIERRDFVTLQNKPPAFRPVNPIMYVSAMWLPTMIGTSIIVLAGTTVYIVPALFYSTLFYGGAGLILLYLREFLRRRAVQLLLFTLMVYAVGLMLFEYQYYASLGAAYAMNGRYLSPILPIFIAFLLIALKKLVGNRYPKMSLAALLVGLVVLFTQGGSIGTAILTIHPSQDWRNTKVDKLNNGLRDVANHAILFKSNTFDEHYH